MGRWYYHPQITQVTARRVLTAVWGRRMIHLTESSLTGSRWYGQNLENVHTITQLGRHCLKVKYNISKMRASEDNLSAQACHLSFAKESLIELILRPRGFYEHMQWQLTSNWWLENVTKKPRNIGLLSTQIWIQFWFSRLPISRPI